VISKDTKFKPKLSPEFESKVNIEILHYMIKLLGHAAQDFPFVMTIGYTINQRLPKIL